LARHLQVWIQLCKRLQHESALVQVRMRNLEERLVNRGIPVEQEVQVERARALCRCRTPVSTEGALQLEECAQQRPGGQLRLDLDGPVQETRLIEIVDGLCVPEARDALDLDL